VLSAYIRRRDFSRWIGDVFGDRALAAELRELEEQYQGDSRAETIPLMANAVRGRYDLAEDDTEAVTP
jgi:hypothetical protein